MAQDFFTVMRSTFTLQRLLILQRARKGEQNLPPLLTCRDVLEFATIEGARCANLDGKVGTLTPGKEADIVVLRADRLDVWPLNNAPMASREHDESQPHRNGLHWRKGEEVARQSGGRGRGAA